MKNVIWYHFLDYTNYLDLENSRLITCVCSLSVWEHMDGSVYGVDTYVVTQRERDGNLTPRFADDALTLWMTDKCRLGEHVEHLTRLQNAKSGFVSIYICLFVCIKSILTE